jgi:hypothetical protein
MLATRITAGLRDQLVRILLAEAVVRDQPADQLDERDPERVRERPRAAGHHQVLGVLEPRPGDRLLLLEVEAERHVHRGLESRAADFAVALQRVPVAEIEERAGMRHRQVHGRPLAHVRNVHVAAEAPRPQAVEGVRTFGGRGDAPEHRPQRERDRLGRAARQVHGAGHALAVQPPHVTPARESPG